MGDVFIRLTTAAADVSPGTRVRLWPEQRA
jgi:hypothetical protein